MAASEATISDKEITHNPPDSQISSVAELPDKRNWLSKNKWWVIAAILAIAGGAAAAGGGSGGGSSDSDDAQVEVSW